jgi:hypothetical protein
MSCDTVWSRVEFVEEESLNGSMAVLGLELTGEFAEGWSCDKVWPILEEKLLIDEIPVLSL